MKLKTSRGNYKSAVKSKNKTKSAEAPHDIFSILFCRRWLRNLRNFGESVGRVGPVHSGLKNTKKIAIKNTTCLKGEIQNFLKFLDLSKRSEVKSFF